MPLAIVHYRTPFPFKIPYFSQRLAGIVATALTIPGSPEFECTAEAVKVRFVLESSRDTFNGLPIEIYIEANRSPERYANRAERRQQIIDALRESGLIPEKYAGNGQFGVWLKLVDGSWGTA